MVWPSRVVGERICINEKKTKASRKLRKAIGHCWACAGVKFNVHVRMSRTVKACRLIVHTHIKYHNTFNTIRLSTGCTNFNIYMYKTSNHRKICGEFGERQEGTGFSWSRTEQLRIRTTILKDTSLCSCFGLGTVQRTCLTRINR